MPQIQPGQQVIPGQAGVPKLYGTDKAENTIPFQERMMRLFKPQEFVTIKNITEEPVYWQYMPTENEQVGFSEDGMQKITTREDPEMWVIMPGETEVIVGGSAYRALDVMYKAWSASTTLKRFRDPTQPQFNEKNEHLPKNFNFADGGAQQTFLELAYIGKATPSFAGIQSSESAPVNQPIAPMQGQMDDTPPPTYATPDNATVDKAKELVNVGRPKK